MNKQAPDEARETKRAQFVEPQNSKSNATLIMVAVLIAAAAVVAYVVANSSSDKPTLIAAPARPSLLAESNKPAVTDDGRVPIADVA
ncbi:MAG TPA: hypothetical protein VLU47_10180, partial [Blastocatellia bacterium]|nr:hypothetical protein [Blastocatellia bacterium]